MGPISPQNPAEVTIPFDGTHEDGLGMPTTTSGCIENCPHSDTSCYIQSLTLSPSEDEGFVDISLTVASHDELVTAVVDVGSYIDPYSIELRGRDRKRLIGNIATRLGDKYVREHQCLIEPKTPDEQALSTYETNIEVFNVFRQALKKNEFSLTISDVQDSLAEKMKVPEVKATMMTILKYDGLLTRILYTDGRDTRFELRLTNPEVLDYLRKVNNPDGEPTDHFTGRCMDCHSNDLWDDAMAYGCYCCNATFHTGDILPIAIPNAPPK